MHRQRQTFNSPNRLGGKVASNSLGRLGATLAGCLVAGSISGCLFWATAASDKDAGPLPHDASALPDAGMRDAGFVDAGDTADGGGIDAGPNDAGNLDAGGPVLVDAGPGDGGVVDGGAPDAGNVDAGAPDAGQNVCGNGTTEPPAEACDDQNLVDDDYCSNDCKVQGACGDGIVQAAVEECDFANADDVTDCTGECQRWWNAEFPARLTVEVVNDSSSIFSNVPFAVRLPVALHDDISPENGRVCAVGDDHQRQLAIEVEAGAPNDDAILWVQVPLLPPGPSLIYIYGSGDEAGSVCPPTLAQVFAPVYDGVWHMESTSPRDATGNGHDATPFGAPAGLDRAFLGKGVRTVQNGHIRVDNAGVELGFLGDMTVEGWIRMDAFQVDGDRSTIFQNSQHLTQNVEPFLFNFMHDGHLRASWRPQGQPLIQTQTATQFDFAQWRHLAWVRDATVQTVTFYVDGVPHGTPASYPSNPEQQVTSGRFRMGGGHSADWSLLGAIDEVRITGRVLSPAWIRFQVQSMRGDNVDVGSLEAFSAP